MYFRLGLLAAPSSYYAFNTYNNLCESNASAPRLGEVTPQQPKKTEEEKSAEELEKILQENPFAAQDPEEMQKILQSKNKSKIRRPPQFAELLGPLRMLTMCEQLDGFRLELSAGVSEKLQIGGSWNFSNTKPSNFSLTTVFSPNASQHNMDSADVIHCK